MSRQPTPSPQCRFIGHDGLWLLVLTSPFVVLLVVFGVWWFAPCVLLLVWYVLDRLYGCALLVLAWATWRRTNIRGVLVYSDSPNWKGYIDQFWMERFNDQLVVLNWSRRKDWPRTLAVRLFNFFGVGEDNFNFNPLVIVFRGVRYPFIYRFFYAFLDAKHNRPEARTRLEAHLFAQLDA